MMRFFGLIAVVGALVAGVFASAASLNVNGGTVQVGANAESLVCDSDGVSVESYMMNDHVNPMNVGNVSIKGLDADCNGARLGLKLTDGFGNAIAYSKGPGADQWVIASGDENTVHTFTLVANGDRNTQIFVPARDIYGIEVWMEGTTN